MASWALSQPAYAYVEGGYLEIQGVPGRAKVAEYKNWIRVEGHYWRRLDRGSTLDPRSAAAMGRRVFYSGPAAPAPGKGGDQLAVALSKKDPVTSALMAACRRSAKLSEVKFAESADVVRPRAELGERPSSIPSWFEYKLKDVEVACPVVAGASEQAFTFTFKDIEWLNYTGPAEGVPVTLNAASLQPAALSGKTKAFVVSWLGPVADVPGNTCPAMNEKPSEKDFFAYMTPGDVVKAKERLAASGGALDYSGGTVSRRGPGFLSVAKLPGIVPANPHRLPTATVAYGLDLDGDGGKRAVRPDVAIYRSFTSPDGRKGIDNQFYLVTACMEGMRGRVGFLDAYANEEMRNGKTSTLLTVTGIDDEQNDDSVDITILYSRDTVVKNATGKDILPDYSFRLAKDPELTSAMRRVKGRIINGVIETDPTDNFGVGSEKSLQKARLRLEIAGDGSLKGVMAGYLPWRPYFSFYCSGQMELLGGWQCPGAYLAFKGAADGLKNPETGEFDGISIAYDVEARPALIPPAELASYFRGAYASK